jgi:hypothetical protein
MLPGGTHMPSGDSGGCGRSELFPYVYKPLLKFGKNWKLSVNGY